MLLPVGVVGKLLEQMPSPYQISDESVVSLATNLSLAVHMMGQFLEQQAESNGAAYTASLASYVVGMLTVSQPLCNGLAILHIHYVSNIFAMGKAE